MGLIPQYDFANESLRRSTGTGQIEGIGRLGEYCSLLVLSVPTIQVFPLFVYTTGRPI